MAWASRVDTRLHGRRAAGRTGTAGAVHRLGSSGPDLPSTTNSPRAVVEVGLFRPMPRLRSNALAALSRLRGGANWSEAGAKRRAGCRLWRDGSLAGSSAGSDSGDLPHESLVSPLNCHEAEAFRPGPVSRLLRGEAEWEHAALTNPAVRAGAVEWRASPDPHPVSARHPVPRTTSHPEFWSAALRGARISHDSAHVSHGAYRNFFHPGTRRFFAGSAYLSGRLRFRRGDFQPILPRRLRLCCPSNVNQVSSVSAPAILFEAAGTHQHAPVRRFPPALTPSVLIFVFYAFVRAQHHHGGARAWSVVYAVWRASVLTASFIGYLHFKDRHVRASAIGSTLLHRAGVLGSARRVARRLRRACSGVVQGAQTVGPARSRLDSRWRCSARGSARKAGPSNPKCRTAGPSASAASGRVRAR